jgi:phage host-nuclease inhibitor protein Gam
MCLFPDFFSFKATMDYGTKSIADYLQEKINRISEKLSEALKQTMDELREFNKNNTAKFIGEVKGWHTTLAANNKIEELMFTILIDREKYIC